MMRAVEAHSCPHHTRVDRCRPPSFRTLHALAVDHAGGRAGLPAERLAALHIERVVDLFDRPVVIPAGEVVVHRAPWRQILGDVAPLAPGAEPYITPFTTSRTTTSRFLPPRLASG